MGGLSRSGSKLGNTYRATCKVCRRVILVGHEATWIRRPITGLVHPECAPHGSEEGTAVVDVAPTWEVVDSSPSFDVSPEPPPS